MKRMLLIGIGFLFLFSGGCAKRTLPTGEATSPGKGAATGPAVVRQDEERLLPQRPPLTEEGMSGPVGEPTEKSRLSDIFFDYDEAALKETARASLQKNATFLLDQPAVGAIHIEGHSDERGTSEYNLALGERRAQVVSRYLVALGVDKTRIQAISFGEEAPFCKESQEGCWEQNRRAHFSLLPPKEKGSTR